MLALGLRGCDADPEHSAASASVPQERAESDEPAPQMPEDPQEMNEPEDPVEQPAVLGFVEVELDGTSLAVRGAHTGALRSEAQNVSAEADLDSTLSWANEMDICGGGVDFPACEEWSWATVTLGGVHHSSGVGDIGLSYRTWRDACTGTTLADRSERGIAEGPFRRPLDAAGPADQMADPPARFATFPPVLWPASDGVPTTAEDARDAMLEVDALADFAQGGDYDLILHYLETVPCDGCALQTRWIGLAMRRPAACALDF
jgi:hypothetical protein